MTLRTLPRAAAMALLALAVSGPAQARSKADKDSWWQCDQYLPATPDGLRSSMVRFVSTDGKLLREEHQLQGNGFKVYFSNQPGILDFSSFPPSLFIDIDPRKTIGTQGVWAFLFADGEQLASAKILSAKSAKRGAGVGSAYFAGDSLLARLSQAERWTLVVVRDDGTEIERRDLPVPSRATRQRLFASHKADIDTAWARRDEGPDLLSPRPAGGDAWCVLSTPESRHAEDMATI